MPMEYLQGLAWDELPLIESDVTNIDKLRVLRAAGMVEVQLPPVDASQPRAKVLYITGLGRATLRARGWPSSESRLRPLCDLEPSFD
ncbi:hypothetical protein [Acidovorax sp. HMWF029]|uniref:hypothetical protein n=1 Tax=Acidovorax sp. HMWF029 TaxID=2056863 RepID=UPI0018EEB31E|nr:hypothetical protein [Acidovorax sp. HMWF029]